MSHPLRTLRHSIARVKYRLKKFLDNFLFRTDTEELNSIMSWLSSSPGIYPAEARANQICEFISRQLFNKVSKKDLSLMLYGLIQYRRTGKTPKISHYANIRAYEQTNGLAQELFHYAF